MDVVTEIIYYRQRMDVAEKLLREGHYQYVIRECGALLEVALRACYERILSLTRPDKTEALRKAERALCSAGQSYLDLGLGKLVRLMHEAHVFERLEAKESRSYADARSFNFNHIVRVEARNDATHRAAIPDEITARLAHANLLAFLKGVYLLELPPELQQQREEAFSVLLVRHWRKGHLTEADQQEQAQRGRELELSRAQIERLQAEVQETFQALIATQQKPTFEPPLPQALEPQHNLPTVLASQVQAELKHYLSSTFPMRSERFSDLMERFLDTPGQVLRGPYLSLRLPFQTGSRRLQDFFPALQGRFTPYRHQEQAFERLSAQPPRPTLVATGTGSGKTECFLYPLLQHCYQQRGRQGIKALIIYPMNALATDQARRIARLIWQTPALKGQVNAGLYVGARAGAEAALMKQDSVITQRAALRDAPPDILLTNYKMLDLLLTRPEDQPLWRFNDPETLRFLVVDEIHTFDGAQGTDLACLIRRLSARLRTPAGHLCPVGTSATLGQENRSAILDYVSKIFGAPFEAEALIQEQRQSYADFLFDADIAADPEIPPEWLPHLDPRHYPDYSQYIQAQYKIWFGQALPETLGDWRVALGQALKTLPLFQNLVRQLRDQHLTRQDLLQALSKRYPQLNHAPPAYGQALLDSLMALISSARSIPPGFAHEPDPPRVPFLQVRAQLWVRELRRLVASVHPTAPALAFSDDHLQERFAQLPLVHCRECHHVAWGARRHPHRARYNQGLQDFYSRYIQAKDDLWLLYPDPVLQQGNHSQALSQWLCPICLNFAQSSEAIQHSGTTCQPEVAFEITALPLYPRQGNKTERSADCQICSGQGSLNIVGQRAATLTAVMIAQIFGSVYSADKKIIAFSDSVQDASYRAGFFTARTYAFTLRSALQKYLDQLPPEKREGLPLTAIQPGFSADWLDSHGPNAYIAQFFPADLIWLREYEHFCQGGGHAGTGPESQNLQQLLHRRLDWEIYRELTFRSRTGRTLEKAGLAMVSVPLQALEPVVQELQLLLPEAFPHFAAQLSATQLRHGLALLLQHLKLAGAVYHPELDFIFREHMPYGMYVNTRKLNPGIWLPRRQGYAGPRPLTLNNSKVEALQLQQRKSWYQWLAEHLFFGEAETLLHLRERDPLLRELLQALVRHGILRPCDKGQHPGWAIAPEQLRLSTELARLRCDLCQHTLTVPAAEASQWQGQPCGRRPCDQGHYLPESDPDDYYARYYRQATPQRIYAAEHTGLLAREQREAVEAEFMAPAGQRQPWFTNLLSSTPTLEMGIDIGDLSSVLLCSVPPSQSNYLQRIGRSGRSDGNSLNVTVAAGRPHDLYYFREPLEMIAGEVQTPGVFLGAAAVLERQLTAYCFDRWVASGIAPAAIDKYIKGVLATLSKAEPDLTRFPYNLLAFITAYQQPIFADFMQLFGPEMPAEQRTEIEAHLWAFLQGDASGSLAHKLLERLTHLAQSCRNFQKDIDLLKNRIKRLEAHPERLDAAASEELEQMYQELSGLRRLVKQIRDKQVYNFLTDEGLLPNYAFPEEGITLRSVVYRKQQPGSQEGLASRYEAFEYEYVRPAASALVELAPNNHFYAGGRRVQVNQVELRFDESQPGFEDWRFCDRCSHMAPVSGSEAAGACPRCGSEGWADRGQVHTLLRMRQVFANTNMQDSLNLDSSEERSAIFFDKSLRVDFDPADVLQAYRLSAEHMAFGFEYIRKAQLREVNFGEAETDFSGADQGPQHIQGQGFVLCRACGMVQNPRVQHASAVKARHAITCRRPKSEPGAQDLFCTSFLYRAFASEALRIFLPDDPRYERETCTQSFIAALQLGLKAYFSGNIDHLAATVQTEPLPGHERGRAFLVLYDQVPGGTGYLKQLCKPGAERPVLLQVLTEALATLRSCSCQQDPALDGCYQCILTYRQASRQHQLSRATAMELLAGILQHADQLQPTASISQIRPSALQESELERRFLEALRRLAQDPAAPYPLRLTPDVIHGKLGYLLQINGRHYSIEPQVALGPEQGVAVPSRADFLIRSLGTEEPFRPIAVYTDGFRFHHDRLDRDTAQRMALLHSGRYFSWSLSWEDVDQHISSQPATDYAWNPLPVDPASSRIYALLKQQGSAPDPGLMRQLRDLRACSPLLLLVHYLAHPQPTDWARLCDLLLLNQVRNPGLALPESQLAHRRFKEALLNQDPELYTFCKDADPAQVYYFPELIQPDAVVSAPEAGLQALVRLPQQKLQSARAAGQFLLWVLDDSDPATPHFQALWNGFLQLLNLYQFGDQSWFVSRSGLADGAYAPVIAQLNQQRQAPALDPGWRALEGQLSDEAHLPLLHMMAHSGCALPVLGYEPSDARGEVLGLIEYAFVAQRFGLVLPEDLAEMAHNQRRERIASQGWTLLPLTEAWIQTPEPLIAEYATQMGVQA